nr:hypothetical protein GCM10020092_101400 [Actinoplanes digitatis]
MPLPHPARRTRRHLALATAALTLVSSALAAPAAGSAATPAPAEPHRPGISHTITLITGDRVRVTDIGGGRYATDVQRPDGARGGVHAQTIGSDLYVFPDEVLPYLAADRIDRRLFDVTTLIRDGYDDRNTDGIPLIISHADGTAGVSAGSRTAPRRSAACPACAATPYGRPSGRPAGRGPTSPRPAPARGRPTPGLAPLADGIAKIWLDGKVHTDLAESTAQVGAPTAWAAGLEGAGVKVAVLDTGADLDHPDLAGRVSAAVSFVPGEEATDGHGHGTHTASTVGGSGAASAGAERGVAPKADLLIGKVLSDEGAGSDSWVIAGMEWAAAQGARVVSMSLGDDAPSDGTDPLSSAVNRLTAQTGALFVIAAEQQRFGGVDRRARRRGRRPHGRCRRLRRRAGVLLEHGPPASATTR